MGHKFDGTSGFRFVAEEKNVFGPPRWLSGSRWVDTVYCQMGLVYRCIHFDVFGNVRFMVMFVSSALLMCVAWSGQVVGRCKTLSAGHVKFKRAVIVTGGECLHVTTQVPREEVSQISQKAPKTTTVWSQSDDSILVWKTTLNTRNSIKDPLRWVPGN